MRVSIRLYLLLIFLCVGSCRSQQWYSQQVAVGDIKFPGWLASICADKFKVSSDTFRQYISVTDTIIQPGETIFVDCDSVLKSDTPRIMGGAHLSTTLKMNKVSVKCPPSKIIHTRDTIKITINKENTARVDALKIENKGTASSLNSWRNAAFIFGVLFIVSLLIIFFTLKRMK